MTIFKKTGGGFVSHYKITLFTSAAYGNLFNEEMYVQYIKNLKRQEYTTVIFMFIFRTIFLQKFKMFSLNQNCGVLKIGDKKRSCGVCVCVVGS
jgi:hypothetical protein